MLIYHNGFNVSKVIGCWYCNLPVLVILSPQVDYLRSVYSWVVKYSTFLVLTPKYSERTRLVLWLLMPWLLMLPDHLLPLYWLYKLNGPLSYLRKDFKYLCTNTILLFRNNRKCKCIFCFFAENNSTLTQYYSRLTHCSLVTPYGDTDLGQHWFR